MKKSILSAIVGLTLLTGGCGEQPREIFNGKDLNNWHFVVEDDAVPGDHLFTVEEGVISVKGRPLGYTYTKEKYRNFTLRLEYRWAGEAGNSGIFFLIEEPLNPFPKGIECQLMAGRAGDLVMLSGAELNEYMLPLGLTERPEFPVIDKGARGNEKPTGEWNKVAITVNEGVITVYINGLLQNSATSEVKEGHIGLQSEGAAIQFRNISLDQSEEE